LVKVVATNFIDRLGNGYQSLIKAFIEDEGHIRGNDSAGLNGSYGSISRAEAKYWDYTKEHHTWLDNLAVVIFF
jgi:hypothetical protein